MMHGTRSIGALAALVACSITSDGARGQIGDGVRGAPSEANHFIATPSLWRHPMQAWAEPDIEATLDMMEASRIPLERCGTRYQPNAASCHPLKPWLDPNIPQRQTSLIVDPPNGLLPALTPEGKARAHEYRSDRPLPGEDPTFDGPGDFDSWDRCITRGMPSMMLPYRRPMRNDPGYRWPESACHEDNTIVRTHTETSRYERAHPTSEPPQPPVEAAPAVAEGLAGRWVGRPRIVSIDVDIELEFARNADGTISGRLVGTNLGRIDKPLREFSIDGRDIRFTLPNIDPWSVAVELTGQGTLEGIVHGVQGGMPVIFRQTPIFID